MLRLPIHPFFWFLSVDGETDEDKEEEEEELEMEDEEEDQDEGRRRWKDGRKRGDCRHDVFPSK